MLKGKDVYVLNLSKKKCRNYQMKLIKLVKIKQFWSEKMLIYYKLTIIVCVHFNHIQLFPALSLQLLLNFPTSIDLSNFSHSLPTSTILSNLIENFPTSTVTFQLHLYFPTSARTFQLQRELSNFILSNFMTDLSFFPTALSNYTYPVFERINLTYIIRLYDIGI